MNGEKPYRYNPTYGFGLNGQRNHLHIMYIINLSCR